MLPYVHQHQHLPLACDYDYPYTYDIALALPQHPFTDTPQTLIPTPSDLLSSSSPYSVELDKPKPPRPDPLLPDAELINKTETQRKARQRAVAEEIGFVPTDPDTISSHEKKRHYLECLEHYVLYLHEQLSIRTLLVHMQNVNKNLHQSILAEEQVFMDLSAEVVATHDASDSFRHHPADVDPWSNYIAEPGSVVFGSEGSTYDSVSTNSPSSSRGSLDGMGFPFEGRL